MECLLDSSWALNRVGIPETVSERLWNDKFSWNRIPSRLKKSEHDLPLVFLCGVWMVGRADGVR